MNDVLNSGRRKGKRYGLASSIYYVPLGFPGGSVVRNLPAMQEPWV